MTESELPPIDWKIESQRFDGVAELYHTYRPSYPDELIDDIILHTGIQPEERILEIGSGTGKATLLFAQRGYTVVGLEPGQNLIATVRKNLSMYPQVSFVRSRFEDWDAGGKKFDLVISAQAYHWVPEEVRYEKTANVLKHGRYLGVFWNMYPGIEGEVGRELDRVYREIVPEMAGPDTTMAQLIENRANSLRESPYFENVIVRQYPWSARYDTETFLGLINTYSNHLRLSAQKRSLLFKEIAEVIERYGGSVERPYLAVVYMAKRTSA